MKKQDVIDFFVKRAKTTLTEQELSFVGSIGESIELALQNETVERNKQLSAIDSKVGVIEGGDSLMSIIRGLSTTVEGLETKMKRTLNEREKNSLRSVLEANKEVIRNSRKKDAPAWELEFKAKRTASALMTTSTLLTGAVAINNPNELTDMEITFIQYPANFILDAIGSRQVAKVPASRKWKEQIAAGTGVPAAVAEGVTKPLVDYAFEWKYSYRKKYAAHIEMTEEDEIDMEQLTMDIIALFERDVIRYWQDGVLTDILAWCPSYTSTGLDDTIVAPTVYSVIGALKLQAQDSNYQPDIVILNPADAASMLYIQDSNGNQQFIPESLQFGGLKPFITNKIDAGTIMVGVSMLVEEQHGNFIVRRGTYGTQFIENEFSVVGEIYSNLKLPTESKKGWVKGDIDTVKAALLVPSA